MRMLSISAASRYNLRFEVTPDDSPYTPPSTTDAPRVRNFDARHVVLGQRFGWASLLSAVAGIFGTLVMPWVISTLDALDLTSPELWTFLFAVRNYTSPGILIAIIVGTIGYWGFRSRMARISLFLAAVPIVLFLAENLALYVMSVYA